ncbi:MAG: YbhB/YbcL family Raf kinase inhibitor-like protein [Streptosporangiales bacterium]|nr:YbhB/YbcL family Raf kinase inhibitor-like protein [Streptosporangiales bacterium]
MTATRLAAGAAALAALTLVSACGLVGAPKENLQKAETITVSSPAFRDGGRIPTRYTCQGTNISPPLRWSHIPSDAEALALVVDDRDAPGGTYVHWVVFNIHPTTTETTEGTIPAGGQQARNSAGEANYRGPCPSSGSHRYRFTVYALRQSVPLADGADLKDAIGDIPKRSIAHGRLTALFQSHH